MPLELITLTRQEFINSRKEEILKTIAEQHGIQEDHLEEIINHPAFHGLPITTDRHEALAFVLEYGAIGFLDKFASEELAEALAEVGMSYIALHSHLHAAYRSFYGDLPVGAADSKVQIKDVYCAVWNLAPGDLVTERYKDERRAIIIGQGRRNDLGEQVRQFYYDAEMLADLLSIDPAEAAKLSLKDLQARWQAKTALRRNQRREAALAALETFMKPWKSARQIEAEYSLPRGTVHNFANRQQANNTWNPDWRRELGPTYTTPVYFYSEEFVTYLLRMREQNQLPEIPEGFVLFAEYVIEELGEDKAEAVSSYFKNNYRQDVDYKYIATPGGRRYLLASSDAAQEVVNLYRTRYQEEEEFRAEGYVPIAEFFANDPEQKRRTNAIATAIRKGKITDRRQHSAAKVFDTIYMRRTELERTYPSVEGVLMWDAIRAVIAAGLDQDKKGDTLTDVAIRKRLERYRKDLLSREQHGLLSRLYVEDYQAFLAWAEEGFPTTSQEP